MIEEPKCPSIPADPKLKEVLKPELKILMKCRVVALFSVLFALATIVCSLLKIIPFGYLTFVFLFAAIFYHEHKQYEKTNDVLILKRFMNDPEYKKWYSEVHLKTKKNKEV